MQRHEIAIFFRSSGLRNFVGALGRVRGGGRDFDSITKKATRSSRAVKAYGTETRKANKATSTQARAVRTSAKEMGVMTRVLGMLTKRQRENTAATNRQATGLRSLAKSIGAVVLTVFTLTAALGQLRSSVQTFAEFENRMSAVQAVTSSTSSQLSQLEAVSRKLGETTVFSAVQAAEAEEAFGRAGFQTLEIVRALPATLDLAAAAQLSMADAAATTGNLLRVFNLEAAETGRVSDVLARAASSANTTVLQLGEQFKFLGPVAANLGKGIEETGAALAVLANQGLADISGTALRRVFAGLVKPTDEAKEAIEAMGLTMADLDPTSKSTIEIMEQLANANITAAEAFTIAGQRGGPALLALTSQVDQLRDLTASIEDSAGAAETMSRIMRDNVRGDALELRSVLEELKITFGEAFAPALRASLDDLTAFFAANKDAARAFGEAIGNMARVITTAFVLLGSHFNIVLLIIGSFLASKLLVWLAALGASLAKRVVEWGTYATAAAGAAGATNAAAVASGRAVTIYGAQGQALKTVTVATAANTAATGAATAATWSFSGAVRGLTAAMASNPVGLVVVGLTLLIATFGSVIGTVSEARAATEAYHVELREGRPEIAGVSAAHDQYADTLDRERSSVESLHAQSLRLRSELEALEPVSERLGEALDSGNEVSYLRLVEEARQLDQSLERLGENTAFEEVDAKIALLNAEIAENTAQLDVARLKALDAEQSLSQVAEQAIEAERRRLLVTKARLAETNVEILKAEARIKSFTDAIMLSADEHRRLGVLRVEFVKLQEDAELAAAGVEMIRDRMEALVQPLGTRLGELLSTADIEGVLALIDKIPDEIFGEVAFAALPPEFARQVVEGERSLLDAVVAAAQYAREQQRLAEEARKNAESQERLNKKLKEQTERFKALKGSLEDEAEALGQLAVAALKGEEAFSEAQRAAEVERRFRAESAKLTEINADALDELRGAIARVIDAEKKLAGSKTIAALEQQAENLTALVAAYDDSALAAEIVQAGLELEAEIRANVSDAVEGQRDQIEQLTKALKELEVTASASEDVRALEDEVAVLKKLAAAYKISTKAAQDLSRELEIQAQVDRATSALLAQQARLLDELAAKKQQLIFLESNLVIGGQALAAVMRGEIDAITRQLDLNEQQRADLEEQIRLRAELTDTADRERFLASIEDENELLRVELDVLQKATRAEIEFGVAAKEAAIAVEVQRQIMAHGAEGIEEYKSSLRAAIEENEALKDAIDETHELGDAWTDVGNLIGEVIGMLNSDLAGFGQVIGDAVQAFRAFRAAGGDAQGNTGIGAFFNSPQGGQVIDSAAGAFGSFLGSQFAGGGTSNFGGQMSGSFSAEGAQLGAIFGGWGAFAGAVIGAFFKKSGDVAEIIVEGARGEAQASIRRAEGGLAEIANDIQTVIDDFIDDFAFLAGVQLNADFANIAIEIRDNLITVTTDFGVSGFRDLGEALAFVGERLLIANEQLGTFGDGLGENIERLVEGLTGPVLRGDFEDLSAGLRLAAAADDVAEGRENVPGELRNRFREINALRNEELALARKYGLVFKDVIRLTDLRIAQARREIKSAADGLLGVTNTLGTIQAITASMEEFNRQLEREHASRQQAAQDARDRIASLEEQMESAAGTFEGTTGEIAMQIFQDVRSGIISIEEGLVVYGDAVGLARDEATDAAFEFLELARELGIAQEELEALEESLGQIPEAFDPQEIIDVWTIGAAQAGLALIDMLRRVKGEAFLAEEAQELQSKLFMLQLAAQIAAVQALLAATDLLDDATRALLQGIVDSANDVLADLLSGDLEFDPTPAPAPTGRSGRSGRQERQRERSEIIRDIQELRLAAAGVADSTVALRNSFRDFDEWVERARELGIAEDLIAQARADNLQVIENDLLAPFREIIAQAGETELQTGIRQMAEEFQIALSDAFALAEERAETFGTTVADEFPRLRDTILEAFGISLGEEVSDQISDLAAAGDVTGLQTLIADLLATDLSGISPDLQRQFREMLDVLIAEAELAIETLEATLADRTGGFSVEFDFDPIQDFLDLADGLSEVDVELRNLQQTFAGVIAEATLAGATEEDLARIRTAHAAAIGAVRTAVLENVQEYTDAVQGISALDRDLIELREGFEAARDGVLATDAALRELGEEASSTDDLELLAAAYREALMQVRQGILDSVQEFTDAVLGIGAFERKLLDLQETFSEARGGLESVDAALAGADDVFGPEGDPTEMIRTKFVEGTRLIAQEIEPALAEVRETFDLGMAGLVDVVRTRMSELGLDIGPKTEAPTVKPGVVAGPSPTADLPILLGAVEDATVELGRDLVVLDDALGDVSGSTLQLETDLELLEAAERRAIQQLGVDFVNSLEQLGVSLPTELVLELARAEFELARAEAVSSALALAAAGAFQDLSISLDELLDLIGSAEFDPETVLPPRPSGGGRGGGPGRGGGGPEEDLEGLRQQVLDQIEAWNRLPLGEVTNQAIALQETLVQLRVDAAKAGVALEDVDAAFQVALDAFVDDALSPFEDLNLSPLQRELDGIVDQFVDLLVAFETAGASSEQMVRLQETFASAMDDFLERATSGIRNFLDELRGNDPQVSAAQTFQGAQSEFRDLLARAQSGDLEALEQLEQAARDFRAQAVGFLGGGVGMQEVLDEIIQGLESIEDVELVPADIALLREQAESLLALINIGEAQSTSVDDDARIFSANGLINSIATPINAVDSQLAGISELIGDGTDVAHEDALLAFALLDNLLTNVTAVEDLSTQQIDELLSILGVLSSLEGLTGAQSQQILDVITALSMLEDLSQDQIDGITAVSAQLLASGNLTEDQLNHLADVLSALGVDITGLASALFDLDLDASAIAESLRGLGFDVFDIAFELSGLGFDIGQIAGALSDLGLDIGDVAQVLSDLGFSNSEISDALLALGFDVGDVALAVSDLGTSISDDLQGAISAINDAIDFIKGGAASGALVKETGPVFVHAGERILSPAQTAAFESLGGLQFLSDIAGSRAAQRTRPRSTGDLASLRRERARARRPRTPPVRSAPRPPQPPAAPPAKRRPPPVSVQVELPVVDAAEGNVLPPDEPARRRDVAEALKLDQSRTADGLETVRKEIERSAKERRKEQREEAKMMAAELVQGSTVIDALAAVVEELQTMRREARLDRNAQTPAGKAE